MVSNFKDIKKFKPNAYTKDFSNNRIFEPSFNNIVSNNSINDSISYSDIKNYYHKFYKTFFRNRISYYKSSKYKKIKIFNNFCLFDRVIDDKNKIRFFSSFKHSSSDFFFMQEKKKERINTIKVRNKFLMEKFIKDSLWQYNREDNAIKFVNFVRNVFKVQKRKTNYYFSSFVHRSYFFGRGSSLINTSCFNSVKNKFFFSKKEKFYFEKRLKKEIKVNNKKVCFFTKNNIDSDLSFINQNKVGYYLNNYNKFIFFNVISIFKNYQCFNFKFKSSITRQRSFPWFVIWYRYKNFIIFSRKLQSKKFIPFFSKKIGKYSSFINAGFSKFNNKFFFCKKSVYKPKFWNKIKKKWIDSDKPLFYVSNILFFFGTKKVIFSKNIIKRGNSEFLTKNIITSIFSNCYKNNRELNFFIDSASGHTSSYSINFFFNKIKFFTALRAYFYSRISNFFFFGSVKTNALCCSINLSKLNFYNSYYYVNSKFFFKYYILSLCVKKRKIQMVWEFQNDIFFKKTEISFFEASIFKYFGFFYKFINHGNTFVKIYSSDVYSVTPLQIKGDYDFDKSFSSLAQYKINKSNGLSLNSFSDFIDYSFYNYMYSYKKNFIEFMEKSNEKVIPDESFINWSDFNDQLGQYRYNDRVISFEKNNVIFNFIKSSQLSYIQIFKTLFSIFFFSFINYNFFVFNNIKLNYGSYNSCAYYFFNNKFFINIFNFIFFCRSSVVGNVHNVISEFSYSKWVSFSEQFNVFDYAIFNKSSVSTLNYKDFGYVIDFPNNLISNTHELLFNNKFKKAKRNAFAFPKTLNITKYIELQSIQIIIRPFKNNTYCTIIPLINDNSIKKQIFNKSCGELSKTKGSNRRSTTTKQNLYNESAFALLRFGNKHKKYRFSVFRPKSFHKIAFFQPNFIKKARSVNYAFKSSFFNSKNQRRFPTVSFDPIKPGRSYGERNRPSEIRRRRTKRAPKWLTF